MKKLYLILSLAMMPFLSVMSQIGEHRNDFTLGVNGGYILSNVSFTPKVTQGYHGGLTGGLSIRYVCEKYFKTIASVYAEVNYSQLGWKEDILDINKANHCIIQDRSIFEGVHVFVANNRAQGNLSERDYQTFMELFEQMVNLVHYPDLLIYLRASIPHLVANIQKRGRDYEQRIQIEYLKGLNERYEDFIQHSYGGRVLTIDVDGTDFQHNREDFARIVDKVNGRLFSLFPDDNDK